MAIEQLPKAEHLFLLIGTNPLPNYVAAKLMLKEGGHLYLINTKETSQIADRLINILKTDRFTKIQVNESAGEDILSRVADYTKGIEKVGLNYTGGTKTMAVHAYKAVEKYCPDAVFSYLDARTLSMVVERRDQPCLLVPVALEIKPTIKILLGLHGYTFMRAPITSPFKPEMAQVLSKTNLKQWRKWCTTNLHHAPNGPFRSDEDLASVSLPPVVDWQGAQTLNDLAVLWGRYVRGVANWLDGKWLENYTLWSLKKIAKDCHIHEAAMSIIPRERNFEFDVVAMRGYQLFAISCSTVTEKGFLKQKLFEAYVRARQMGGEEARIGLVCCAPSDKPDSNPAAIQKEIEESWEAEGKVRVFGAEHLPDLPSYLQDWFNSQPS